MDPTMVKSGGFVTGQATVRKTVLMILCQNDVWSLLLWGSGLGHCLFNIFIRGSYQRRIKKTYLLNCILCKASGKGTAS